MTDADGINIFTSEWSRLHDSPRRSRLLSSGRGFCWCREEDSEGHLQKVWDELYSGAGHGSTHRNRGRRHDSLAGGRIPLPGVVGQDSLAGGAFYLMTDADGIKIFTSDADLLTDEAGGRSKDY